ncbi:MAG: glutaredoxin family protein [Gammaproteobacteria bacterium]
MNELPLRLFLRRDCEICEALHALLETDPRTSGRALECIDIDEHTDWRPLYHYRVPVLVRGTAELWAGPVGDHEHGEFFSRVLAG